MFTFYYPELSILLVIPLLFWIFIPTSKHIKTDWQILFPNIQRLEKAFNGVKFSEKTSTNLIGRLILLLWICLVVSLMQPQWLDNVEYNNQEGYDIMLAVDTSQSMHALDFGTRENPMINRLDVTKEVVGNFVKQRKGDRIGLIVFGQQAYLHSPMSFDTIAISKMINDLVPGIAGSATSIGDAMGVAIKEIKAKEKSKILILLTDGVDNSSTIPPLKAANIAKDYGIRIYTIGVGGNNKMAPFPDGFGDIQMIPSEPLDEALLTKIAQITNGKFFRAKDSLELEKIYQEIDSLEKIQIDAQEYKIRKSLYRYPLFCACIVFLLLCVIPLFRWGR